MVRGTAAVVQVAHGVAIDLPVSMQNHPFLEELSLALRLAYSAGQTALQYYSLSNEQLGILTKADSSPVTMVDKLLNDFIVSKLSTAHPTDDLVAEEDGTQVEFGDTRTWFVDPIDGTKDFIAKTDEWCVMIGLVSDACQPVFGVLYAPALQRLYFSLAGCGAYKQEVPAARTVSELASPSSAQAIPPPSLYEPSAPPTGMLPKCERILVSHAPSLLASHPARSRGRGDKVVQRALEQVGAGEGQKVGSMGLKLALVAEGAADLSARTGGRFSWWDVAAPLAVLREAGGQMVRVRTASPFLFAGKSSDVLQDYAAAPLHLLPSLVEALEQAWADGETDVKGQRSPPAPPPASAPMADRISCHSVAVLGDSFVDVNVGPLQQLPKWGLDTACPKPILLTAGGSALNTAVQLAGLLQGDCAEEAERATTHVVFHTVLGEDEGAALVRRRLQRTGGVLLSSTAVYEDEVEGAEGSGATPLPPPPGQRRRLPTGSCVVLSSQQDRAFATHYGAVAALSAQHVDQQLLLRCGHLHVAGLFNAPRLVSTLAPLLKTARAQGLTISLDPQSDSSDEWEGVLSLLPLVDILMPNEAEALALTGCGSLEDAAAPSGQGGGGEEGALSFLAKRCPLVVVTRAAEGVVAVSSTQGQAAEARKWTHAAPAVEVVDPTGAGDAFKAGFLFGWIRARRLWKQEGVQNDEQGVKGSIDVGVGVSEGLRSGVGMASLIVGLQGASPLPSGYTEHCSNIGSSDDAVSSSSEYFTEVEVEAILKRNGM